MSAMGKMLIDMLLKDASPEIKEALTQENFQRIGNSAISLVTEIRLQGVMLRKICDHLGIEYDNGSNTGTANGADAEQRRIANGSN